MIFLNRYTTLALLVGLPLSLRLEHSNTEKVIDLLRRAKTPTQTPILSPADQLLSGNPPLIKFADVQRAGFPLVVWTIDDPLRMRQLIEQRIDGIISDRPDLLRQELTTARRLAPQDAGYFDRFDAEGHRGGRDLRPENTLPAFEAGLDNLITTIETDTGVTADHVSLISHEQFINPQTCRANHASEYSETNKIWIKDITMAEAQRRFTCDKTFRGPNQKNDLSLSPVAVEFAQEKGLLSPYAPTNVEQLYDFVAFYATYYRTGKGKDQPDADLRWRNEEKVRFNLETKITPEAEKAGHTFSPQMFVDTLCGAITRRRMESRSDVQSFDFRTLALVQKQLPEIQTVYLLEASGLSSALP
ncbi:MAG: glycerophosphodiester phosphodiesterase [Acidobacteriaceae bacterium]|nr:glycerophosphodiester phosphodiesterase [Acidobacteriaceae bacterium]